MVGAAVVTFTVVVALVVGLGVTFKIELITLLGMLSMGFFAMFDKADETTKQSFLKLLPKNLKL